MGIESQKKEALRWFRQAEDDLSSARVLNDNKKFAQSCFYCQQASEKAVKALWFQLGLDPWGHSVLRLIEDIDDNELRKELDIFSDHARALDRFYMTTRYPNGLPELIPFEAYSSKDSAEAIKLGDEIIQHIRAFLKI